MSAKEVQSLKSVLTTLRDAGVVFSAAPEDHLNEGYCTVLFYFPIGTDNEKIESALENLDKYNKVAIGDETFVLQLQNVVHTGIHSHRQIVLFNQNNMCGLDEVSVAQGSENIREFVKNEKEPTPVPSKTIDAETLIRELADAGAVAVTLEPMLCNENRLTVKTWLPPETGYDVVGSYRDVKVGSEVFDLQWEFVCDSGPGFLNRVPLYTNDDVIGKDEMPISAGISNLVSYVEDDCPRSAEAYQVRGEQ